MEENAIKGEIKRDQAGRLLPGHGLISPGRPKGQTMKEFAREQLLNMDGEEKIKFLASLPAEIRWKMAEGNPHQTQATEITLPDSLLGIIKTHGATNTSGGPDVSKEGTA